MVLVTVLFHMIMVSKMIQAFLRKRTYLRSIYIESKMEEDVVMKNHFRIEKLLCPMEISDAVSKSYDDRGLNHPSMIRDTAHVDFNYKNLHIVPFFKVISLPAVGKHITAKIYVDNAVSNTVNESWLLRIDPVEEKN